MGRKKIVIKRLTEDRNRNVTFLKRKHGLLKKAWELSVLCGAEVSILIFSHSGKCYEFSSSDLDQTIDRYHAYSGPIERRRSPEFAAQAESGGKDDASDLEDDEPPQGEGSNGQQGPKGMSLKGKEEWKDVSQPKILRESNGHVDDLREDNSNRSRGNQGRSRPDSRTPPPRARESSRGRIQAPEAGPSRQSSGSWNAQVRGEQQRIIQDQQASRRYSEDAHAMMQERAPMSMPVQPLRQPQLHALYNQPSSRPEYNGGQSFRPNHPDQVSSFDQNSFRSDMSRYNGFGSNSVSSQVPSAMTHPAAMENDGGQNYAQYSLPVDSGINPDGTIDWHRAAAAAQLQAALHAQQAQLAYLRQQRQQQDHWRELLAATTGGSASGHPGMNGGLDNGVGSAVQRFNELVAAGPSDASTSGGFEWPTHAPAENGLGLSTATPEDVDPGMTNGHDSARDSSLTHSVGPNGDWYSESAMRSSAMAAPTGPRDMRKQRSSISSHDPSVAASQMASSDVKIVDQSVHRDENTAWTVKRNWDEVIPGVDDDHDSAFKRARSR